jgi:DNA-binding response OmpR family regulator
MLVEDELFIALDLEDIVTSLGFEVTGPFATVADALQALDGGMMPRAAILDVQLRDGEVFPVATRLADAGVPIIFHSGHVDAPSLRTAYPSSMICSKPCSQRTLQNTLEAFLSGTRPVN